MFHRPRILSSAIVAASLAITPPALAQDEPTAATVVTKVGETEITLGHMLALRSGLPAHYDQLADEVLFKGILDQLVQQTLLMQMVEKDPSLLTRLMVENETRAIFAAEAIRGVMDKPIDEEAIQAAYAEKYADQSPATEYRAAHILVETEDEAKDIIAQLEDGGNFSDLAKTLSTGPSGPNGGDLGWFGPGVMVAPFFDAVAALEPGGISQPVQTQFGWHVINLIETRIPEVPKLDDVRAVLEEELQQKSFEALIQEREAQTEIDRSGAEGIDQSIIKSSDILEK